MSATATGKRKDDGDEAGSDDAGDAAPLKKVAKRDANESDGSDDVFVCEISKNRRVSVRSWKGKIFVDIREFYLKDGKQYPGKKGISLSMDQWNVLRAHVEEIDKAVNGNS